MAIYRPTEEDSMTRIIPAFRLPAASLVLAGGILLVSASIGSTCGLRWASTPIAAHNIADCFAFANKALTDDGFAGIHQTSSEVTGSKSGAFTAITCFQFGSSTTVVIMVVGENDGTNLSVLNAVKTKITSFHTL
jgi:hypothetical protein